MDAQKGVLNQFIRLIGRYNRIYWCVVNAREEPMVSRGGVDAADVIAARAIAKLVEYGMMAFDTGDIPARERHSDFHEEFWLNLWRRYCGSLGIDTRTDIEGRICDSVRAVEQTMVSLAMQCVEADATPPTPAQS